MHIKKNQMRLLRIKTANQITERSEYEILQELKALNKTEKSITYVQEILADNPWAEQLREYFYQKLLSLSLNPELMEASSRYLEKKPRDKLSLSYYAAAMRAEGDVTSATTTLEKLYKLQPNDPITINALGSALKDLGYFKRADELFNKALKLAPAYGKPLWNRSDITQDPSKDLQRIDFQISSNSSKPNEIYHAHFAGYRIQESRGNYEDAFNHLKNGNLNKRKTLKYNIVEDEEIETSLTSVLKSDFIKAHAGAGNDSAAPIFIVGFPRSGTTLVEQIISSHSEVKGLGEIPFFVNSTIQVKNKYRLRGSLSEWLPQLRDYAWREIGDIYLQKIWKMIGEGKRFTDKALLNYRAIGIISLCLPNAKIIQVDRNAMDVCFGCYRQLFNENWKFTYDFDELAAAYASYQTTMSHWEKLFPSFLMRVSYEELIRNFDKSVSDIISFCELEHEVACLNPHENQRVVTTLSATQVRQPVFRSGINRWRVYEEHLTPLQKALTNHGFNYQ